MIFDVLKQRWLRKEFLKLENSSREHHSMWPKSLIVIFDANQFKDVAVFYKWAEKLKIPSKSITLLGFTKDTKKDTLEGVTLFDSKLIKWNGGISSNDVKKLLETTYDLQINYFETSHEVIKYVSLKLRSALKVGYPSHEESTYDLAVNVLLTKQELFISEIAKYLKILNS